MAPSRNGKAAARRPRLLVLNQYYAPGVEATAHLLAQLCRDLAATYDVTVVTGMLGSGAVAGAARYEEDGVHVIRVRSAAYDRRRLSLRALNYVTYLVQSLRAGLAAERPDAIVCMTDPPMLADVGLVLARRFRAPLVVISQDVFPEIAVELKRLENRALVGLLRALVNFYLRRADRVVAIGDTMRNRLEAKGASPDTITVIPNWVDAADLTPQPRRNSWSHGNGLDERFVVMHSGNTGHAQDLGTLVRSATFLRDLDDLTMVVIGQGARRDDLLALSDRLETDHLRFLPYQPREALPESLSAADIHVVGLARGLSGFIVPSRLYGILAVGRPVIVAAEEASETAQVVTRVGCGVVVPPGRPELLAGAIRSAYDGELDLAEMGRLGREFVLREATREVAVAKYRELLDELVGERQDGSR